MLYCAPRIYRPNEDRARHSRRTRSDWRSEGRRQMLPRAAIALPFGRERSQFAFPSLPHSQKLLSRIGRAESGRPHGSGNEHRRSLHVSYNPSKGKQKQGHRQAGRANERFPYPSNPVHRSASGNCQTGFAGVPLTALIPLPRSRSLQPSSPLPCTAAFPARRPHRVVPGVGSCRGLA